jgi:hypothetical protein
MPGSVLPKSVATRQRRNKVTSIATLEAAPATRVPLPDGEWRRETTSWWSTIWDSPMAAEWVDADVPGLVALARLVDAYWGADISLAPKIHAEIRMSQREFGLTPFSRRQLQWEVKRVQAAERAVVVPPQTIASRRERMKVLTG